MSKNSRIIAFAGRKRSGKSMLANGIKSYYPNSVIVTIADNLKFLCCKLLNTTYNGLIRMKDDGTVFEVKVNSRWITLINQETGITDEIIYNEIGDKTFTTVREVLQVIGTDLIRKYTPDWHIDKTVERIKSVSEDSIVIVDDLRFPNEKCKIEALGGEVFFLMRPNCFEVSNHPSERALSYCDFDKEHVIINDLQKNEMIDNFIGYYFGSNDSTQILLSENPWYCQHSIDMSTDETNFNADRRTIIRLVLQKNISKPQFNNNGIITFCSSDYKCLDLFRRIIMNDRRSTDGCDAYSVYNPITNEILKLYM